MMNLTPDNYISRAENINIYERTDELFAPPHTHDFIELVYIRSGDARQWINSERYEVSAGDLLFINYGQVHEFQGSEDFRFVNFLFMPEFISQSLLNTENIFDIFAFTLSNEFEADWRLAAPIARFRGKEFLETEYIVNSMLKEYAQKQPGYRSILKAYMQLLFGLMVRNIRAQEAANPNVSIHKITPELLHYIDLNCFDKLKVQSLAEKCFYTPNYFSRIFKEVCGKSLTEYIKEKRIAEAVRLLTDTDKSIAEIRDIVGYTDRKQFNKFFKQYTSRTPSEYRQELLGKAEAETDL